MPMNRQRWLAVSRAHRSMRGVDGPVGIPAFWDGHAVALAPVLSHEFPTEGPISASLAVGPNRTRTENGASPCPRAPKPSC